MQRHKQLLFLFVFQSRVCDKIETTALFLPSLSEASVCVIKSEVNVALTFKQPSSAIVFLSL